MIQASMILIEENLERQKDRRKTSFYFGTVIHSTSRNLSEKLTWLKHKMVCFEIPITINCNRKRREAIQMYISRSCFE